MYRKSLALLATGLFLFAALLIQMNAAQAASPSQTTPDVADEEPQPLPQPLRIRINQAIPLTLSVPASLLTGGAPVTTPLTGTVTGTRAITGAGSLDTGENLDESPADTLTGTAASAITGTAALTSALTSAQTAAEEAAAELIDEATAALTGTNDLTATGELTTVNGALDETADTTSDTTADETTGAALDDEAASEDLSAGDELTETDVLTAVMPMVGVPVTLELSIDLVVTNTLTSTVPASVTLQLADRTTRTLPLSVTVASLPDGEVVIELLPAAEIEEVTPEATPELTATEEITAAPEITATPEITTALETTPTVEVTATVEAPSGLPVVNTTTTTTANLRAGPATTFDLVGQVGPGATVAVVGVSQDAQWYLLDGGTWIAAFLTADAQLPNLPLATQELIDQASGNAPVAPGATPAITPTEVLTPAAPVATPIPPATTPVTPTTTTDANLRAGPGTEFPLLGGTILGQEINIVGRNADGTWFRLDNTGWIFGELVANPPALETVPVVNADGTLVEPAATPTPAPPAEGGGLPFPTATPAGATGATAETAAADSAETTGANAAYISSVEGLINTYDGIVQTMDSLIAEARANSAVLTTPAWADRANAAVTILRRTGASVGELQAPAALAGAQTDLVAAAQQYAAAGAALAQAATTGAVAQLDTANTAITEANTSLAAVETALAAGQ